MFCPKCKAEYREGFLRCSGCGVDLVSELPSEPERSETDAEYVELFPVKTYSSRHDAELERGFLSANGIEAAISGDDCGGIRPALSFSMGVRLLVKKEDVDEAKELLDVGGTPTQTSERLR
jgi:hypothetical protein